MVSSETGMKESHLLDELSGAGCSAATPSARSAQETLNIHSWGEAQPAGEPIAKASSGTDLQLTS